MADPYAGRRYSDRTGKGLYEEALSEMKGSKMSPSYSPEALGQPKEGDFPKPPGLREYLSNAVPSVLGGWGAASGLGMAAKAATSASRLKTGAQLAGATALVGGGAATVGDILTDGQNTAAKSEASRNQPPIESGLQERAFGAQGAASAAPQMAPSEGLRRAGVSNIGDANEGLARMARANAIRQEQLGGGSGRGYDPDSQVTIVRDEEGERKRAQWERDIDKFSMVGKTGGRAGRAQQALDLQEDGLRQRAEEAAMKNAADLQKLQQLDEMGRRRDALDREKFEFDKEDAASVRSLRDAQADYYRTGGRGSGKATTGLKGPKEVASAAEALYGPERASVVANDVEARRRDGIRRANEAGDSDLAQALATGDVPEAAVKIDGDLGIVRDVSASENMFGRGLRMLGQGGGTGAVVGGLASLAATRGKKGWKPLAAGLGAGGIIGGATGLGYGVTTGTKGVTSNTPAYQLEGWTRGEDGTWVSPDGKASIPEAALRHPGLGSAITGLGGRDITPYLEALGYKP